jgi:hypothetical protein
MNIQRFGNGPMVLRPLPTSYRPPARTLLFLLIMLVAVSCPLSPVSPAYAADWELTLSASLPYPSAEGGRAAQSLTVGVRATAQDGFDNASDTKSLGGAIVSISADHPNFSPGHQLLARDLRADHYPQSWAFAVSSNQDGRPITLSWTLPAGQPGSCQGMSLSLTDVTAGATVNLLQPSYIYTNTAATPRRFMVTATQAAQSPPPAPVNLFGPLHGSASIHLAWSGVNKSSVVGYHVYRRDPGTANAVRRTAAPVPSPKYLDSDLVPGGYAYFVTAVTATGCESPLSDALAVTVKPKQRRSHPSQKPSDHNGSNQ